MNNAGSQQAAEFNPQPSGGDEIHVKLVKNGSGNVAFYVDDMTNPKFTANNGSLGSQT